jgi:hypothetical protein
MSSNFPRGYSTISPSLYDQKSRLNELETLKKLNFQNFKNLIRNPIRESEVLIVDVAIILLSFKEISVALLEKTHSSSICQKIPCQLKDLLKKLIAGRDQILPSMLLRIFEETYASSCIIDTSFDIFQLFLHSFATFPCFSLFDLNLDLKLKNEFSCLCGRKKESFNEVNYLAVQIDLITDFISDPLHRVFKAKLKDQVFGICSNPRCELKKSKKTFEITELPFFLTFKLIWNEDFHSTDLFLDSIKQELNISEFSKTLKSLFKVSIIFLQNEVIFHENGIWITKTIKYSSWDLLLSHLKSKNAKVLAVVYSKNAESSHSASSTLTRDPATFQESSRYSVLSNKCVYCKAPSLQLCRCEKSLCTICRNAVIHSNGLCISCSKKSEISSPETKYSTFSVLKCSKCKKTLLEDGFCSFCTLEKNGSAKDMKTAVPVNTCKTCLKEIKEAYCVACDSFSTSGKCARCSGKSGFDCVKCRNDRKSKRNSSNFNVRKKCSNCTRMTLEVDLVCFYCHQKKCKGTCPRCRTGQSPKRVCNSCSIEKPSPIRSRK